MSSKYHISDWPCSWEEHEMVELRDGMRRSFRDKLIWLEEATELVRRLQAAPVVKESTPSYGHKSQSQGESDGQNEDVQGL